MGFFALQESLKTGLSFGLTSAVITTMGLIVGLQAGTHSRVAVLGGILTIAVADAFSDALGIHISEEFEGVHSAKQVWAATLATFLAKFFFTMIFAVPLFLLPLGVAIVVDLCWGFSVLTALSYVMARMQARAAWKIIGEHLAIAVVVLLATEAVGQMIAGL